MRHGSIVIATCLATLLGLSGCIDPDSDLVDVGEGCDEFEVGEAFPDSVDLEPEVRRFIQASADLSGAAIDIRDRVYTTCAAIATDLGADDTWSEIDDPDNAISNSSGTGACDAAAERIEKTLVDAGVVEADIGLLVSEGQCHVDFDALEECDTDCTLSNCDRGTAVTRCEPGSLSVFCDAECEAGAICVGRPELPANCMGRCESECVGQCDGVCLAEDGSETTNDPNCRGKCSSSCNGTCRGLCRLGDSGAVACGVDVRCTGGCSGEFTEPVCTTEYTPPSCELDEACYASCSARVNAEAECDPPVVELFVDLESNPMLEPLVETLEENLPALIEAAQTRGRLISTSIDELGDSGEVISDDIEDLSGKSLACIGVASGEVANAIGALGVTVEASLEITVTTDDMML